MQEPDEAVDDDDDSRVMEGVLEGFNSYHEYGDQAGGHVGALGGAALGFALGMAGVPELGPAAPLAGGSLGAVAGRAAGSIFWGFGLGVIGGVYGGGKAYLQEKK
jgi:hypothetical protein